MSLFHLDSLPPIQRTLAIPLVGRARADIMFPELGFADPAAARIMDRLHFAGTDVLARDRKIVWGSILRTQAFDEVTAEFASQFGNASALSLGVGLCTRALRFDTLRWLEVDVPKVIEAREALVPASPSTHRIAADLSSPRELDAVIELALARGGPVLVIAEGLLMFLEPEAQHRVLAALDRRLPPGSRLVFDYLHPVICRLTPLHGSIRTTGAKYVSGFRPRRDLRAFTRLMPDGLRRFEARLHGWLRTLQRTLAFLAGSPLYEIACLRVR